MADLLDSVPGLLCGPELYVYCLDQAYAWDAEFRAAAGARQPFRTRSPYLPARRFVAPEAMAHVGLDDASLAAMVNASDSLAAFIDRFAEHFASWRGCAIEVLAEKTPINGCCLSEYCDRFPGGLFVHVVRDGRSVVASLMARGRAPYEAAYIWMVQTAFGQAARHHANAVELRFEDLVAAPYRTVADLAARVGVRTEPAEIEAALGANAYRRSVPRLGSWTVPSLDAGVRLPTPFTDRLPAETVAWLETLAVRPEASPGRRPLTFGGLLRDYGYALAGPALSTQEADSLLQEHFTAYLKAKRLYALPDVPLLVTSSDGGGVG